MVAKPIWLSSGRLVQAFADSKIVGVVDCGLGTQRAIFFMTLLDAGVFVIDVQGGSDVLRDDAGAKVCASGD